MCCQIFLKKRLSKGKTKQSKPKQSFLGFNTSIRQTWINIYCILASQIMCHVSPSVFSFILIAKLSQAKQSFSFSFG